MENLFGANGVERTMKGMQSLLALIVMNLAVNAAAATPLHDGDIIFHTSRSAQSAAIQRATHSPYSHMGVVLYRDAMGMEIGGLQKLREFDLKDPAVQAKMRERYGKDIPLDERVISPAAMFDSALLKTVTTP
jgi:hypothetical protein